MYSRILLATATTLIFVGCSALESPVKPSTGVVSFQKSIPSQCSTGIGLKQKVVRQVFSEKALIDHYGLTMLVRFNDKISPELYGTLYYQNPAENRYCMALPDGRFAMFSDSQIDTNKRNVIQEVCYPFSDCGRK